MKKAFTVLFTMIAISCQSIAEPISKKAPMAIDLSNTQNLLKKFWVVSKRHYPRYPIDAATRGISGCVDFRFTINSDGQADNIEVIKLVPDETFISSAADSLKKYRWKPSQSNFNQQPVITTLQLNFSTTPEMLVSECIQNDA